MLEILPNFTKLILADFGSECVNIDPMTTTTNGTARY
jgi:hypothetical protein